MTARNLMNSSVLVVFLTLSQPAQQLHILRQKQVIHLHIEVSWRYITYCKMKMGNVSVTVANTRYPVTANPYVYYSIYYSS